MCHRILPADDSAFTKLRRDATKSGLSISIVWLCSIEKRRVSKYCFRFVPKLKKAGQPDRQHTNFT